MLGSIEHGRLEPSRKVVTVCRYNLPESIKNNLGEARESLQERGWLRNSHVTEQQHRKPYKTE